MSKNRNAHQSLLYRVRARVQRCVVDTATFDLRAKYPLIMHYKVNSSVWLPAERPSRNVTHHLLRELSK